MNFFLFLPFWRSCCRQTEDGVGPIVPQYPNTLGQSGSGGVDIVDEQDPSIPDQFRVRRIVNAQHVGPPGGLSLQSRTGRDCPAPSPAVAPAGCSNGGRRPPPAAGTGHTHAFPDASGSPVPKSPCRILHRTAPPHTGPKAHQRAPPELEPPRNFRRSKASRTAPPHTRAGRRRSGPSP